MIYLDNNATTAMDSRVFERVLPLLSGPPVNPSSIHRYGQKAKALLTQATKEMASFFDVSSDELIFTSGATEALNMLIYGLGTRGHVITSSLEHVAVLQPVQRLEKEGISVTYLDPLPNYGSISARQVEEALRPDTSLIVLLAANNETGIITDFEAIAALAEEVGVALVVDGVALLGKAPLTLPRGVSAICFSSHKIYGPLGVGVAVVRKKVKFDPLIVGGPQQQGRRGGTENLPGIVGLSHALSLLSDDEISRINNLRNHFENGVVNSIDNVTILGKKEHRICNTSNIAFLDVDGETLLMTLDLAGVAVSHGSACSSGGLEPSRVLLNMGLSREAARSSIRFSLGRYTTKEEIDQALSIIIESVSRLRGYTNSEK